MNFGVADLQRSSKCDHQTIGVRCCLDVPGALEVANLAYTSISVYRDL